MTNALPLLEITDGTTSINLLDAEGILLYDWIPGIPEAKNGGVWSDSPLSEGRKLQYRQLGNVVDTFELKVRASSQDSAITKLQDLRRLLEKAIQYWTSDEQNVPVYLKVRAAYETNTRYAVVFDYRTPKDSNPFTQPFFGCKALVDDFLLSVEHGIWQDNVPGSSTCVELSAQQAYAGTVIPVAVQVTSGIYDDCYKTTGLFNCGTIIVYAGNDYEGASRYQNVTIPAGATIAAAHIEFTTLNDNTYLPNSINVRLYGEDTDDAAVFSDVADYNARVRTTAYVNWDNVPKQLAGTILTSPDISSIIQEIVDRVGWASGQDMVVFLVDNGSALNHQLNYAAYFNGEGRASAVLYVQYTTATSSTFGRAATCNGGEVFIANKHNHANLTNIYSYDDSITTFSANLVGAATPFAFLPATPAAGDIAYFGCSTAVGDSGPFNNLVFDILVVQANCEIIWEYYNGASWATLTVQDNSAVTYAFDRTGVHSVHWVQPSNWAASAINGVTAFWVRARVVSVGAPVQPPQQDNRNIYSAVWPSVEFAAAQVGGDIPALARILLTNQSDASDGTPDLRSNRIIMGTRSTSRGDNFTPYLNVSDEQNPIGVTVAVGANSAFAADPTTPTGRRATYTSPASTTATKEVTITLDSTIANEYMGRFRALLRYKYNTGSANAVSLRLITTPGGSGLARYSDYFFPQVNTDWQVADFGIVNIQPRNPSDEYGTVKFEIECQPDTNGRVIYFYDLVLMPVDEWSTDAVDKSGLAVRTGAVGNGDLLDVDSVTYPRKVDQAILRAVSNSRITGYFQNRQPGPALLQANATQRLWVFCMAYESGTEVSSWPSISHSVQMYCAQRYLSARGRR